MSHLGKGYDINQTFVIEPFENNLPVLSACTVVYTNFLQSCSGDTSIFLGTGIVSISGNLQTNIVSATTYYGDGSNLTGIFDAYVTGGTYSNGTIIFTNNSGGTFSVNGLSTGYTPSTDIYVTGGTYSNGTTIFTNNTGGTFDVNGYYTGYTPSIDVFVTGGTYSNGDIIFVNNTGGTFNVNGFYTGYTPSIDVFVTGGTYNLGTAIFTNNTGGTFTVNGFTNDFTGGTISGETVFTNGLTANTISASTYYNLPLDVYVTGGTYSNGEAIFVNNTGGTFNISGFNTGTTTSFDVFVTGGTYSNGNINFINNTGGTFNVSGLFQTSDDVYTTGLTLNTSNYDLTLVRNDGVSIVTNLGILSSDMTITGGTYNPNTGVATFTNNTGGTFNVTGFLTGQTDTYVTGFTYSNNQLTIKQTNNQSDLSLLINSMSGLTVGVLSATTYLGLPLDVRVTGGTYSSGIAIFTNNTGGTFSVSGFSTGGTSNFDVFVTGATYNNSTNDAIFTNNTGGTFNVNLSPDLSGFVPYSGATQNVQLDKHELIINTNDDAFAIEINSLTDLTSRVNIGINSVSDGFINIYDHHNLLTTSIENGVVTSNSFVVNGGTSDQILLADGSLGTFPTDVFVTGGTYSNGTTIFTNNTGGTFSISGYSTGGTSGFDVFVTGGTYSSGTATFTNNTGGTFNVTGFSTSGGSSTFTGGTVSGPTIFTNGLTANTISASTYFNLPLDIRVTGGTYSNGTTIFTNNTGGTFNVSGYYTGYTPSIDVFVTGGTYSNGTTIFTNNTGGTFSISGFSTGSTSADTSNLVPYIGANQNVQLGNNDLIITAQTDSFAIIVNNVTGGTQVAIGNGASDTGFISIYDADGNLRTNIEGGRITTRVVTANSFIVNGGTADQILLADGSLGSFPFDVFVTGGTYSSGTATFTNNTGGTFNVTGFSTSGTSGFDVFVTGGTYSNSTGIATFRNNTGGTFTVGGFSTGGSSTFTGGTVSGPTNFLNGLIANTISATTYQNLPLDIRVTGGTYSNGTTILTNNTGGTISISGYSTGGTASTGATVGSFGITIDGLGGVISLGQQGYISIPYNATINGWTLLGDQVGDCIIDVWKDSFGSFPPTSGDTIAGSEKPTLSAQASNRDLNLTTWTTNLVTGDVIGFNVLSATSVTRVNLIINVTKL